MDRIGICRFLGIEIKKRGWCGTPMESGFRRFGAIFKLGWLGQLAWLEQPQSTTWPGLCTWKGVKTKPTPEMNSLLELLQEQVRDLYDAKFQYQTKIEAMIHCSTDGRLREVLQEVSDDVNRGLDLLREVCEELDVTPDGVTCEAMRGLIRETNAALSERGDTATIDANLIANAQRIAHYEIAGFGTARAFARCLGMRRAADILGELTTTAKTHDRALSQVATGGWFQTGINLEAVQATA